MSARVETRIGRAAAATPAIAICLGVAACGTASREEMHGVAAKLRSEGERLPPLVATRRAELAACLRRAGVDVPVGQIESAALVGGPKGVAGRTARFRALWETCERSVDIDRRGPAPDTVDRSRPNK